MSLLLYLYIVITVTISSSCPERKTVQNSMQDSDTDAMQDGVSGQKAISNSFGQKKTSHYNREPHKKSALMDREKVATRQSRRIKQIMKDKKELDEVSWIIYWIVEIFDNNIREQYLVNIFGK